MTRNIVDNLVKSFVGCRSLLICILLLEPEIMLEPKSIANAFFRIISMSSNCCTVRAPWNAGAANSAKHLILSWNSSTATALSTAHQVHLLAC
jgi:hypothetical protein